MLLKINPDNPEGRKIRQVIDTLEAGGIIIYPTDTVYGIGCDIFNHKAVERICQLRGLKPEKAMLSFMCADISQVSEFSKPINNEIFRIMKRNLPGPFTFILNSNNKVPKLFKNRKRTIGVRIPDNNIVSEIVSTLGRPILTTSLKTDDEIMEYLTDPIDIYDDYKKRVDIVIDGGVGGHEPSTVIDCTGNLPEVIREGLGELVL
jgi:tRNA threonylcarbamoyl adenosine modification protein (Sua5/YciO/YrdC/YwlC family)